MPGFKKESLLLGESQLCPPVPFTSACLPGCSADTALHLSKASCPFVATRPCLLKDVALVVTPFLPSIISSVFIPGSLPPASKHTLLFVYGRLPLPTSSPAAAFLHCSPGGSLPASCWTHCLHFPFPGPPSGLHSQAFIPTGYLKPLTKEAYGLPVVRATGPCFVASLMTSVLSPVWLPERLTSASLCDPSLHFISQPLYPHAPKPQRSEAPWLCPCLPPSGAVSFPWHWMPPRCS